MVGISTKCFWKKSFKNDQENIWMTAKCLRLLPISLTWDISQVRQKGTGNTCQVCPSKNVNINLQNCNTLFRGIGSFCFYLNLYLYHECVFVCVTERGASLWSCTLDSTELESSKAFPQSTSASQNQINGKSRKEWILYSKLLITS